MVRRRVPSAEVDDIVQATFTEALVSKTAPDEPDALRRWIFGVARNKVVDFHRRTKREAPPSDDMPEIPAEDEVAHSDRDLLRWAEKELPSGKDAPKTLEWMLREGAGEKLEAIAASEKIPAPTVRQRVHRLRSLMKKKWAAEIALVAALGLGILLVWLWHRRRPEPIAEHPKILSPREMARELRQHGLDECDQGHFQTCIEMLDSAAQTDPDGDQDPRVQKARDDAKKALTPSPTPSPAPSAIPSVVPSAVPSETTTDVPKAPPPKPTADPKLLDLKKKEELFQREKSTKPAPFTKESLPDPTGSSDIPSSKK
jgi:RNA polymerase sigma factor (sigma-70 family)